jgi:hypothetical protein
MDKWLSAAGVAFINLAERYIEEHPLTEYYLRPQIDKIKNHEVVLRKWLTPEQYLKHDGKWI